MDSDLLMAFRLIEIQPFAVRGPATERNKHRSFDLVTNSLVVPASAAHSRILQRLQKVAQQYQHDNGHQHQTIEHE